MFYLPAELEKVPQNVKKHQNGRMERCMDGWMDGWEKGEEKCKVISVFYYSQEYFYPSKKIFDTFGNNRCLSP